MGRGEGAAGVAGGLAAGNGPGWGAQGAEGRLLRQVPWCGEGLLQRCFRAARARSGPSHAPTLPCCDAHSASVPVGGWCGDQAAVLLLTTAGPGTS